MSVSFAQVHGAGVYVALGKTHVKSSLPNNKSGDGEQLLQLCRNAKAHVKLLLFRLV